MIVVGATPDALQNISERAIPSLVGLRQGLLQLFPPAVGVHVLPFGPAQGDDAFACNDWFAVLPEHGSWEDLGALCGSRPTIIDGVYNHVGLEHDLVQKLFAGEAAPELLVGVADGTAPPTEFRSPRGGPAIRILRSDDQSWAAWQTFSDQVVDLDLFDESVRSTIRRHLRQLRARGVFGLRLDAAAYYGKPSGQGQPNRHHPNAKAIANWIADEASDAGLEVFVQLDADADGLSYFEDTRPSVPIVDYGYSAHLCLAIATQDCSQLAKHLNNTFRLSQPVLRAARTHDGILLRSKSFELAQRRELALLAKGKGIDVRSADDEPYELNCSLPFFIRQLVGTGSASLVRRLWIDLTCFLPGCAYLYLPAYVGYEPEADPRLRIPNGSDPRFLNRAPISSGSARNALDAASGDRRALAEMMALRDAWPNRFGDHSAFAATAIGAECLLVENQRSGDSLVCNFSNKPFELRVRASSGAELVGTLPPLGRLLQRGPAGALK